MVSSAEDERTASRVAVERAAEALRADVAVLLRRGEVVASVGFRHDPMAPRHGRPAPGAKAVRRTDAAGRGEERTGHRG